MLKMNFLRRCILFCFLLLQGGFESDSSTTESDSSSTTVKPSTTSTTVKSTTSTKLSTTVKPTTSTKPSTTVKPTTSAKPSTTVKSTTSTKPSTTVKATTSTKLSTTVKPTISPKPTAPTSEPTNATTTEPHSPGVGPAIGWTLFTATCIGLLLGLLWFLYRRYSSRISYQEFDNLTLQLRRAGSGRSIGSERSIGSGASGDGVINEFQFEGSSGGGRQATGLGSLGQDSVRMSQLRDGIGMGQLEERSVGMGPFVQRSERMSNLKNGNVGVGQVENDESGGIGQLVQINGGEARMQWGEEQGRQMEANLGSQFGTEADFVNKNV